MYRLMMNKNKKLSDWSLFKSLHFSLSSNLGSDHGLLIRNNAPHLVNNKSHRRKLLFCVRLKYQCYCVTSSSYILRGDVVYCQTVISKLKYTVCYLHSYTSSRKEIEMLQFTPDNLLAYNRSIFIQNLCAFTINERGFSFIQCVLQHLRTENGSFGYPKTRNTPSACRAHNSFQSLLICVRIKSFI